MTHDWHHAALTASKVPAFGPYCLWPTALTRVAKPYTHNPDVVSAMARHSSIGMTGRYVRPQREEIGNALEEKSGLKIGNAKRREQLKVVRVGEYSVE
jgi:hypothetical protein